MKCAQEEYMGVGAARHRHFLSLEVFDFRDRRVLANHQSGPLGAGVDIDSFNRIAVGFSDESRSPSGRPKVDTLAVQQFQRFVATQALGPLDRNPITGEILLQKLLIFQHQAYRVVIGIVELNGRRLNSDLAAAARGHRCNDQHYDYKGELQPLLIVQLSPFTTMQKTNSNLPLVANFVASAPVSPRSCPAGVRLRPVLRTDP